MSRSMIAPSQGRRTPLAGILPLVVLAVVAFWLAGSPAGAEASSQDTQVFRGEYEWVVDGHRNVVEATFQATGDGLWDVEFQFRYARRQETYLGEAEGRLSAGSIRGTVRDGQGTVRYAFEAEVQGDRLEGKHFDIWSGRKKLTGTLRLVRVADPADESTEAESSTR